MKPLSNNSMSKSLEKLRIILQYRLDFLCGWYGIPRPHLSFEALGEGPPRLEIRGDTPERIILPETLVAPGASKAEALYMLEHEFSHYLYWRRISRHSRADQGKITHLERLAEKDHMAQLYRFGINLMRDRIDTAYTVQNRPPYLFNPLHLKYSDYFDVSSLLDTEQQQPFTKLSAEDRCRKSLLIDFITSYTRNDPETETPIALLESLAHEHIDLAPELIQYLGEAAQGSATDYCRLLRFMRDILLHFAERNILDKKEIHRVYDIVMNGDTGENDDTQDPESLLVDSRILSETDFGACVRQSCISQYPPLSLVSSSFIKKLQTKADKNKEIQEKQYDFTGRTDRETIARLLTLKPPCRKRQDRDEQFNTYAQASESEDIDFALFILSPANDFIGSPNWSRAFILSYAQFCVKVYLSARKRSERIEVSIIFWTGRNCGKESELISVQNVAIQSYFDMTDFDEDLLTEYLSHMIVASRYCECPLPEKLDVHRSPDLGWSFLASVKQGLYILSIFPQKQYHPLFQASIPSRLEKNWITFYKDEVIYDEDSYDEDHR